MNSPNPLRICVAFFALLAVSAPLGYAAESPAAFSVGEFSFARPADWTWVEVNTPMRKAQMAVKQAGKPEQAEVVFFHFGPGNGGGTQANVDRWLGQFQESGPNLKSKVSETTVGGRKVTYVQAEGTYMSGTPGGPKTSQPGSMLLGAIIESSAGSVFIRMTGPVELVKTSEPVLKKMVEDALKKK